MNYDDCQMETLQYDLKASVEVVKSNLGPYTNVARVMNCQNIFYLEFLMIYNCYLLSINVDTQ